MRSVALLTLGLLALVESAVVDAAPKWRRAATWEANGGGEAQTYVDVSGIVRKGKLLRTWVMTDFSEFQQGDWFEPEGNSRAYMSYMQLMVFDCETKDVGYGSWHANDGPLAGGKVIHSENVAAPTVANSPVAPGSVGDAIVEFVCKQKR